MRRFEVCFALVMLGVWMLSQSHNEPIAIGGALFGLGLFCLGYSARRLP